MKTDVLIIGAGLIGSSVAMHLAKRGVQKIRVIDFDLEGSLSSSELNAGGVRATWVQPVNIELSKQSIDYFAGIQDEVGFRASGYLWLHSAEKLPGAIKASEIQNARGCGVELLDLAGLKRRVPFIDKTEGIAGAVFSPKDGLINPNLLKNHFRAIAKAHGAVFEDRIMMRSAEVSKDSILVRGERFPGVLSHEEKIEVLSGRGPRDLTPVQYQADRVVNCAGPWAPPIAKMFGYSCPSIPVRRQVSIFDSRDVDLSPYGMIVDTSGVYFHPEASSGLSGFLNRGEPSGVKYHYDGESFFNEHIWPALYERSTHFEKLRHITGWAGQYEVSPDECAILGQVRQGTFKTNPRVYEAHSFSGHGVMQSYSAGLALAELMVDGRFQAVDATQLNGSRFETGELIHETLVI